MSEGLFDKYNVEKADGTSIDPSAQYFVLRVDNDLHARTVLSIYADKIRSENNDLARELADMLLWYEDRTPVEVGPHSESEDANGTE